MVLARMRAEPDFYPAVARELNPALGRIVEVRSAALANAVNPARPDQAKWMSIYGHMVGIPDLLPETD